MSRAGGVLAVYCADERRLDGIEGLVPNGWKARTACDWGQFERTAGLAECSLVVLAGPDGAASARRLPAFRARYPQLRVLLVASQPPAGAGRETADEVIPLAEMERELPAALGRAFIVCRSRALPAVVRGAAHVPGRLREALATASNGGAPVRTVEKLALLAGCDRRTLWNQWKHAFADDDSLRLQDFLHWVLLLRATSRKTPDRSWGDVADEIGVHPHTLGRLSRQLAGLSLRDLAGGGQRDLFHRFEESVLRLLSPNGD
jgi:hypothetical protein